MFKQRTEGPRFYLSDGSTAIINFAGWAGAVGVGVAAIDKIATEIGQIKDYPNELRDEAEARIGLQHEELKGYLSHNPDKVNADLLKGLEKAGEAYVAQIPEQVPPSTNEWTGELGVLGGLALTVAVCRALVHRHRNPLEGYIHHDSYGW